MLSSHSNVCILNAGSYIGKTLAVQLAEQVKCQLVLIDSNAYEVQKCLKMVHETDEEVQALAMTLDLSDPEACEQCASDLAKRFEVMDGLIIIGDDSGYAKSIQTLASDECIKQYQINTVAWLIFAQKLRDNLVASESAHIMPILPYSKKPLDNFINAKGSMMDLAQCLQDALKASRVHVDCIDPNLIEATPKGLLKIVSLTAEDVTTQIMKILCPIEKD